LLLKHPVEAHVHLGVRLDEIHEILDNRQECSVFAFANRDFVYSGLHPLVKVLITSWEPSSTTEVVGHRRRVVRDIEVAATANIETKNGNEGQNGYSRSGRDGRNSKKSNCKKAIHCELLCKRSAERKLRLWFLI
jgi:hypothetical protein